MTLRANRLARLWRRVATVLLIAGIVAALFSLPGMPGTHRAAPADVPSPPARAELLSGSIEAWLEAPPHERLAYLEWISLSGLDAKRADVTKVIQQQSSARTREAQKVMGTIFLALALGSLLLILMPLFVSRRRAPRRRALWFSSALCAVVLSVTFLFLLGGLDLLAEVSAEASQTASLERGLVDAAFEHLEAAARKTEAADDALPFGPVVGASDPQRDDGRDMLTNIWANLRYFDPEAFEPAVRWSHHAWVVLRQLPHIVPLLIALAFLFTMRPLLTRLLRMPIQAGRGERRGGRRALRAAAAFVWREWLAIIVLAAVLIPVALLTQLGVRHLSHSLVGVALGQLRTVVEYFGHLTDPPEQTALTIGLLTLPGFLLIATGLTAMALGLFAVWARRVTQLRFHHGVPLRGQARFWRRGLFSMLRVQWIPVLVLWLLVPPLTRLHAGGTPDAATAMAHLTTTAWWLGLALPTAFVLFGGLRGVRYLVTFRPIREGGRELTYELRPSTPEDRAFLIRAHHEGLRPWIESVWGWDQARQDELTNDWLDRYAPDVVTVKGKDAGYLLVRDDDAAVNLLAVVLLPRYQRLGLGTRLVEHVIARADERGVDTVLGVLRPNPAKRLYERLGFEVTSETEERFTMRRGPG